MSKRALTREQRGTGGTTNRQARNRIQSELPADGAVRADPGNKPSVDGVKASEFQQWPKLKPSTVPPEPGKPNFPKRPADQPALTNPLSR